MSRIGNINDFEDNSSANIEVDGLRLLAVKSNGELYLYENNCPHANDILDPMGGSVLAANAMLIICQQHGAEFLSHTGECVSGPCQGESLRALAFTLSNGDIYLD
ncbi:Rieske 2Fe-2S domain-containing protein [Parahaliea sp. F7430]|uniref:Rieske 2Fe-2S domain-containing protein n=1 Tax=Sediminihaliea albiluteola TaxID=2758564 RepID=A0A7W2TW73_9GAMM|nr:Rieske 2Fe-2S domain-containing protein [Sediminihaliea albiluteola]MBA6413086.1 Rieske 2Fe-2S domain-containing protein [Sediminihaliea albiluteola]